MEDFICVVLTAHGCGHCSHFRGNGIIENGKNFTKHSFIESITKHCTFLNIHYKNMSGQTSLIDSVSKFTSIGNNNILQEVYASKNEESYVSVIISDTKSPKTISVEPIKSDGKSVQWSTFLAKKIPAKLSNYTYFYPCFLFISKKNWNQGLENKEFYALTNAGIVKKFPNGTIGLEKTSQSINSRNVQFDTLLKDLVNKKIDLDLHLDKQEVIEQTEPQTFVLKSFEED